MRWLYCCSYQCCLEVQWYTVIGVDVYNHNWPLQVVNCNAHNEWDHITVPEQLGWAVGFRSSVPCPFTLSRKSYMYKVQISNHWYAHFLSLNLASPAHPLSFQHVHFPSDDSQDSPKYPSCESFWISAAHRDCCGLTQILPPGAQSR